MIGCVKNFKLASKLDQSWKRLSTVPSRKVATHMCSLALVNGNAEYYLKDVLLLSLLFFMGHFEVFIMAFWLQYDGKLAGIVGFSTCLFLGWES